MWANLLALSVLVPQTSLDAGAHARASGLAGFELAASGAFARVPTNGLHSADGPSVVLHSGWAEWVGARYRDGRGPHELVGAAVRADWAGRTPVEAREFRQGDGWAVSIVRGGALEIQTRAELEGELLIVTATLRNLGTEELTELFYSREWSLPGAMGWTFPADLGDGRSLPPELARRLWMFDDLAPGATTGATFSFRIGPPRAAFGPQGVPLDVPLELYTDAMWPNGVALGLTNGVSFGDFDADGWIDIFSCMSARLLRNVAGTTWELAADLDSVLPTTSNRYGSSFGDYDNDGLPDIGTEPRTNAGDSCMHLLHNLGAAQFEDVALDPLLFDGQPCEAPSETICWGDVEEDGDLDVFLPVYGRNLGPGNFFMENLGPTGPGGAYRFRETSAEAGLDNPPMTARPEGAQFLDADDDGDMDLYSNGTLYQNQSEDRPRFVAMSETGAGIGLRDDLDEGAAFFDYDLDGDLDLFIVYTQRGVRLWESRGDGTFFQAMGLIDEARTGLDLGLSAEDWDMDGDVDFTTRQVFRRNRLVEDGERHFTVATHDIPANHLTSATPAWGDWDKDGDLDCALGNWQSTGRLYANTLWDAALGDDQKPYLRVRVVNDHPDVPRGLETEYGARVEVVLLGDPFRRVKFVASGHGYLNQNEYVLHFALPPGSDPSRPAEGLVCEVVVDFPSRASRGVLRIDRLFNLALGKIQISTLQEREITVFRSGRVVLDGVEYLPALEAFGPRIFAIGGGLALADPELGLPEPTPAPGDDLWVGIEFVAPRERRVQLKELVLDGRLDTSGAAPFNLALWDVTDPLHAVLVADGLATTPERNRRAAYPFEVVLEPAHVYRCVAHVLERRATLPPGPLARHGLALKGGLDFADLQPTTGKNVVQAGRTNETALALRYVVERGARAR